MQAMSNFYTVSVSMSLHAHNLTTNQVKWDSLAMAYSYIMIYESTLHFKVGGSFRSLEKSKPFAATWALEEYLGIGEDDNLSKQLG